jgi:hypothetical protein
MSDLAIRIVHHLIIASLTLIPFVWFYRRTVNSVWFIAWKAYNQAMAIYEDELHTWSTNQDKHLETFQIEFMRELGKMWFPIHSVTEHSRGIGDHMQPFYDVEFSFFGVPVRWDFPRYQFENLPEQTPDEIRLANPTLPQAYWSEEDGHPAIDYRKVGFNGPVELRCDLEQ